MAAFVPGLREKKRERPFHYYSVEQQNRGEQDSISNVRRKERRERRKTESEMQGD